MKSREALHLQCSSTKRGFSSFSLSPNRPGTHLSTDLASSIDNGSTCVGIEGRDNRTFSLSGIRMVNKVCLTTLEQSLYVVSVVVRGSSCKIYT